MEGRNFTKLQKRMSHEELEKFCRKVTEEYANSDGEFAQSYFCKKYDITKSCYNRVKDYAMVNGLVDDETINKINNKAIANQKLHAPKAGRTTIMKTFRIYAERENKKAVSEEKIKSFVELYVLNTESSKEDLAKLVGISTKEADSMILRAITENIVDDQTVRKIEERSINNTKPENREHVMDFFDGLWKVRNRKGVTF